MKLLIYVMLLSLSGFSVFASFAMNSEDKVIKYEKEEDGVHIITFMQRIKSEGKTLSATRFSISETDAVEWCGKAEYDEFPNQEAKNDFRKKNSYQGPNNAVIDIEVVAQHRVYFNIKEAQDKWLELEKIFITQEEK